jgi:2-oxo-4-hydroxy-4-carboxy-5-ureidoimidazoline decarboxylase
MVTLSESNAMPAADFIARFGDVAEHSPWVAEGAANARPFASREAMIAAFEKVLAAASPAAQLALIRAHPDLAGKAAVAGGLTDESRREQAGAGLASLTPEEFARFTALNEAYRTRFGFPFVFAVKGATKHQILAAFAARLAHGREVEFTTALKQVMRIVRLRLDDRVEP